MHLVQTLSGLYVISGFMVGMLVGLTGVGGGSLMTPLLVLLFKFQDRKSVCRERV